MKRVPILIWKYFARYVVLFVLSYWWVYKGELANSIKFTVVFIILQLLFEGFRYVTRKFKRIEEKQ